jgi:molybdopterin converting factor small subunit
VVQVPVRIPTQLRSLAGGAACVTIEVAGDATPEGATPGAAGAPTVAAVLDALAAVHPALERRVRDEHGCTRAHVNLFVGSENVRDLDGLDTLIPPGAELSIIPAISGG